VLNMRMIVLASAVALTAGCASSTPPTVPASSASASPTPSPSAATPSSAAIRIACHARASSRRPRDHTTVGIEVHTKPRALVTASVPGGQSESGRASGTGVLTLRFRVGGAKPGSRVVVDVRVLLHGRQGGCQASFRPRPRPAVTRSPTPSPSTAASCYPLSNEGTCYEPGEFCRDSDHGASGVAGDGERIICEDNNGWRWEPA